MIGLVTFQQCSYRHHHVIEEKALTSEMFLATMRKLQHDVSIAEYNLHPPAIPSNPNRGAAGCLHSFDPANEVEVHELIETIHLTHCCHLHISISVLSGVDLDD